MSDTSKCGQFWNKLFRNSIVLRKIVYGCFQRKWYTACSAIYLDTYIFHTYDIMYCGCASPRPFTPYITRLTSLESVAYSGKNRQFFMLFFKVLTKFFFLKTR